MVRWTFEAQKSYFPDYVLPGEPVAPGQFSGPRPSVVQVTKLPKR